MPLITIIYGLFLIILGVGGYSGSGGESNTALIPAAIGAPILLLGLLARMEGYRKWAVHFAVGLGIFAFLASSRGLVQFPALVMGEPVARPQAILAQALMAFASLFFVLWCFRSFAMAHRNRMLAEGSSEHPPASTPEQ
jgi:hypothetical protein